MVAVAAGGLEDSCAMLVGANEKGGSWGLKRRLKSFHKQLRQETSRVVQDNARIVRYKHGASTLQARYKHKLKY